MTTFSTSREMAATADQVFAAFADPERLARWWGPAGFSNSFHIWEFTRGGRWSFEMHAPDGKSFRNEAIFAEIEPARKIVVQHDSAPRYRLNIELKESGNSTTVFWLQEFESEEVAKAIQHIVVPANEQNLDRLTAEVLVKAGER